MITLLLFRKLIDRGVRFEVVGESLRWYPANAVTPAERAELAEGKVGIIAAIKATRFIAPTPENREARAKWLGEIGRRAGYDADALFSLIDATVGDRPMGPYTLNANEANRLAEILRSEIGQRPPIDDASDSPASPTSAVIPMSIARKRELRWSDAQFSRHCRQHLGNVGLRCDEDDRLILSAMPRARS